MRPRTNIRTLRDVNTPTRPFRLNQTQYQSSPLLPNVAESSHISAPQDQTPQLNTTLPSNIDIHIPITSITPNRSLSRPLGAMERLNMSMNMHNQSIERITQPQSGSGYVIDHLVTLYGLSNEQYTDVMYAFTNIAPIVTQIHSDKGSILILEYQSPTYAREALKLHGQMLGQYILGVKTTEIHELPTHYVDDLLTRFGTSSLLPTESITSNVSSESMFNNSIVSTASLGGQYNPIELSQQVTMAIRSPDIRQRSNPQQEYVCVAPYNIDQSQKQISQQDQPLLLVSNKQQQFGKRKQSHTRGIATYDEYLRNRGCLSRWCNWFSSE